MASCFLGRPLDGGPYPYLWLDALTQKVREDGRIVNVSVVVATAVNGEGKREIIGMDVGTSEDGAFWLAFLRSLSARGLSGVELVVSDAHQGLRGAIAAVFGGASWQRCRTHFMTNLLTRVPRRVQPWMATMVRTIYQQPSPDEVHAQLDRVTDQLGDRFPQVASLLDEAGPDILAFSSFPVAHWKKHADPLHICSGSGHEAAGHLLIVKAIPQVLQTVEVFVTKVVSDFLGGTLRYVGLAEGKQAPSGSRCQQSEGKHVELRDVLVSGLQDLVDARADDTRHRKRRGAGAEHGFIARNQTDFIAAKY